MTKEEKTEKNLRKEAIRKKLSELQRKISLCSEMLSKAKKCQELLIIEHGELDRELFEETPGIKIIKAKKKAKKKDETKILDNYKKMSTEEQRRALSRLLEIQATMSQKI